MTLLIAFFVVAIAARYLAWGSLARNTSRLEQALVCLFILVSLWLVRTGIQPGLHLHFLGLTTLSLMLGWRLAIVTASLALVVTTLFGVDQWAAFGDNLLFSVVWPVCFSYFVFLLTYSYLPRHLFVYIFVAGFFNGALTMVAQMLAMASYYNWQGLYSWSVLVDDYLLILPLMMLPEGLINGMAIAALVMYKPEWVCTFLDKDYLNSKR